MIQGAIMDLRMPDGRKPEITEDAIQKVTGAVSAGNYIPTAAAYIGLTKEQLYVWIRRGARDRRETWEGGRAGTLYAQLHRSIEHALASAEMRNVLRIQQAAQGGEVVSRRTITKVGPNGEETTVTHEVLAKPDWAASAWWLERMSPQKWGKRDTVRHEHEMLDDGREEDAPINMEGTFLPDPKRRLALRIASARMIERERERIERMQEGGNGAGNGRASGNGADEDDDWTEE